MTRMKLAVLAVVVFASTLSLAGKRPPKDFPLNVEIQSFQTRPAPDTPINYRATTLANIQNTEVIIDASIEGKSYVLSCTTAEVGCASILPGTWRGRWTDSGIEILGATPRANRKRLLTASYRLANSVPGGCHRAAARLTVSANVQAPAGALGRRD
jgi:hypothetical protein